MMTTHCPGIVSSGRVIICLLSAVYHHHFMKGKTTNIKVKESFQPLLLFPHHYHKSLKS